MAIEIVDLPIKNRDFSIAMYINVYQRVKLHSPMVFRFSLLNPTFFIHRIPQSCRVASWPGDNLLGEPGGVNVEN
jgi:hypothetical protein